MLLILLSLFLFLPLSPCLLSLSLSISASYSTIFITGGSRYQETKNGAYSFSLVVTSLRDLRHAYSDFPFILPHSH